MNEIKYHDKHNRPAEGKYWEKAGETTMTEQVYIKVKDQVQILINAGVNLKENKLLRYKYLADDNFSGVPDLTMSKNYELADAYQDSKRLGRKFRKAQKEAKERAAKAKAEEEEAAAATIPVQESQPENTDNAPVEGA